jgi:hypothetical protein
VIAGACGRCGASVRIDCKADSAIHGATPSMAKLRSCTHCGPAV